MVPNFAALGEYTAYSAQARDSAARRRLLAQSLAATIGAVAIRPAGSGRPRLHGRPDLPR